MREKKKRKRNNEEKRKQKEISYENMTIILYYM